MVSNLWKACSEGDLVTVHELLKDALAVDIEIKDHTGVTPLIEAVKNGHLEVVRALLDKGADPTNGSSQGRPQQYTTDPAILELLNNALPADAIPPQQQGYSHDSNADPTKQYYMPPPGPYAYYPPPPPMADGAQGYYPPPPPGGDQQWPGGPGNLPPPDIARYIPCRYYPSCRYGSSCIFLHPPGGPYYPGSIPPPAQYSSPYDPMAQQGYPPNYYAMPPPSFQPPNGVHQHMSPVSPQTGLHSIPPHQPTTHARSGSDIVSPVQGHFSPNGAPPPAPYGPMSPVSPTYSHPGQVPVPLSIPPLPPLQHQAPSQGPLSPQAMYPNPPLGAPAHVPFVVRQDVPGPYASQTINSHSNFTEMNGGPKSPPLQPQTDNYGQGPMYREGHIRRGSIRRGSFTGRKPPCLFFPTGRCKNGSACRFPHIMPDGPASHHQGNFPTRGSSSRPRGSSNGNSAKAIEEKMAAMTVQEQEPRQNQNGTGASSRSQSAERGNRPRFHQGSKPNGVNNSSRVDKRPVAKQRVPSADEFPVLSGSVTPPSRSPGSSGSFTSHSGPTAAQVLQAPPPIRRSGTKESTAPSGSPEPESRPVAEANGQLPETSHDTAPKKLPVSFATIATVTPDASKEVTVSA